MPIDKLEGIRGDLVRTDDTWQDWDFPKLVDALRKWTERNPIPKQERHEKSRDKEKLPYARDHTRLSSEKKNCVDALIVISRTTGQLIAKQ